MAITAGTLIGLYFLVRMFTTDMGKRPTYTAYIKNGKRIPKTPKQMIDDPHSR